MAERVQHSPNQKRSNKVSGGETLRIVPCPIGHQGGKVADHKGCPSRLSWENFRAWPCMRPPVLTSRSDNGQVSERECVVDGDLLMTIRVSRSSATTMHSNTEPPVFSTKQQLE